MNSMLLHGVVLVSFAKLQVTVPCMTFPNYPDIDEAKLERLFSCAQKQHDKIQELTEALKQKTRRLEMADAEIAELQRCLNAEANVRPSLEVLQRMANGIDPFDPGRFKCAVAALPHETPKLSANISHVHTSSGLAERMEAARRRRELGELRVIEGGPPAA